MLRIILSRDNEMNTKEIYASIHRDLKKKRQAYLFVPEQYTLLSDINLMNALGLDAILDVKVKSFSGFSREVLSEVGGIKRPVLGESGRSMLIRGILQDLGDQLSLYASDSMTTGGVQEILRSIDELKNEGISAERIVELSEEESLPSTLREKLLEIALIFQNYEKRIQGKYLDGADRLHLLAEKLESASYLRDIHFYLNSFHDMNQREIQVLQGLLDLGCHLSVALTLDPKLLNSHRLEQLGDGELFATTYGFYQKLLGLTQDIQIQGLTPERSGEIIHLADNLFSYRPEPLEIATQKVQLFQGNRTEEEGDYIAETILRLVRNGGYRFRDISVITTSQEEYGPYLERAFQRERIPYFLDQRKPYFENKLTKILICILNLRARELVDEDVLYFVKFGFLDLPSEEIFTFENYILRRRIHGNMYFRDEVFQMEPGFLELQRPSTQERLLSELETVNRIRSQLLELIGDYFLGSHVKKGAIDHARELYALLMKPKILETLGNHIEKLSHIEAIRTENEQVWEMFISLLEEAAELTEFVPQQMNGREFAQLLLDGMQEMSIGIIPPSQDQVVIGTVMRTRANQTKALFLAGMSDSFLPKKHQMTSLLSDGEKGVLEEHEMHLPKEEQRMEQEEMMAVYSLIQKAEDRLYLSVSNRTTAGENQRPSRYFTSAQEILPGALMQTQDKMLQAGALSLGHPIRQLLTDLRTALRDGTGQLSQMSAQLYAYLSQTGAYEDLLTAIDQGNSGSTARKKLDPQLARALYGGMPSASASRIEDFNACPYRHFIRYGLHPHEPEEFDLEYRELGTLVHGVLSQILGLYTQDPNPFAEYSDMDFERLIDASFEQERARITDERRAHSPKNLLILDLAKKLIGKGARHVTRQLSAGEFRPIALELPFGNNRGIPAVSFDIGGHRVLLEGVIDRVDGARLDGQFYVSILDYKTGGRLFDREKVEAGLELQLLLYLLAVLKGMQGALPAGVFYLPLRDEPLNLDTADGSAIAKKSEENYLLSGIVRREERVLEAYDRDIFSNNSVLRLTGRARDLMSKENLVDAEDFDQLLEGVYLGAKGSIQALLDGEISAYPYAMTTNDFACVHCPYASMCRFKEAGDRRYRYVGKAAQKPKEDPEDE